MTKDPQNLIWIDLEMTGLDSFRDKIIEVATIVTDKELNILAEGPIIAIHQSDAILNSMDDWNTKTHEKSGLIDRVRSTGVNEHQAELLTLEFLNQYVGPKESPMCGNSICQDRRFLIQSMPDLESFFHYRNLDVSTLKELARRWVPRIAEGFKKESSHLAMEDIRDSINELKYYRENLFKI